MYSVNTRYYSHVVSAEHVYVNVSYLLARPWGDDYQSVYCRHLTAIQETTKKPLINKLEHCVFGVDTLSQVFLNCPMFYNFNIFSVFFLTCLLWFLLKILCL